MALLKTYIRNKAPGFTLVEVVICFAVVGFVFSLMSIVDIHIYQRKTFQEEVFGIETVLRRARSTSMNNICLYGNCTGGRKHGVFFEADKYTLFQGDSYSMRDSGSEEVFSVEQGILLSGIQEVVFEQLSGNVINPGKIEIDRSDGMQSEILVSGEGVITY